VSGEGIEQLNREFSWVSWNSGGKGEGKRSLRKNAITFSSLHPNLVGLNVLKRMKSRARERKDQLDGGQNLYRNGFRPNGLSRLVRRRKVKVELVHSSGPRRGKIAGLPRFSSPTWSVGGYRFWGKKTMLGETVEERGTSQLK